MRLLSRRYSRASLLFSFLAISIAVPAGAQTVVSNPTTLTFTPSADQTTVLSDGRPALDHYSFDVYSVGATQPFQSTNIGKPAPAADGLIYYNFSSGVAAWPLPGGNYEARVAAVGPNGSATSTASNAFTFSSCTYSLSGTSATLPAAGGGTQFGVTTSCAWTAVPSASWIAVSPASGTGSATIVVTVAANTSNTTRTATVSLGGQTFTVNQLASSCTFSLSSTAQSFAAAGGTGTVSLTGGTGCGWTATSNAAWITVSPASGSGGGTVSYAVAANAGSASRTGTITIAGATFTVTQAAGAAATGTALPSPWLSQDIGTVGLTGSASYSAGIFTVAGSGADIWGTSDAFRFVYQPLTGDGQIVARVTSETNTNYYAKAGIMLRTSLTATSAHVMLDVMPNGTIEFMTRSGDGASTTTVANSTQATPAWLRLVRSGTTISASVSADGVTWRTVGSTTTSLGTSVSAGLVVTSHDTTLRNTGTFDSVSIAAGTTTPPPTTTTSALPSPWAHQDVGVVGLAGSASYANGSFTVVGSGADIWGTADAFQFVYQPLNGDGQVVARVVSETNTNYYAKAGIMLRAGLAANAPHVMLDLMPNGTIEFMTRTASGASTTSLANATQAAPAWLRLVRSGNTITASVSADGATWRSVGSTTTALGVSVSAGLVVTSHDTTLQNTARFDNVTLAGLPSPWANQDVGSVGLSGSASYASGTFTVVGSGADIWGAADAFQYVQQPSAGDGQIVARMTGEQNTNPYAKAGIMYRAGLAANAAFVMLDVTPSGGVEFITRSAAGATASYLGGSTQAAPAWLRLVRTGTTVTASVSADGATWRTVGSTSITLGTGAAVGLIVTSHDTTVRNTATFDNVSVR